MTTCDELLKPSRLWTRAEVLSRPSPVPKSSGIYAWYFRALDGVPSTNCLTCGEFKLLYIGISPSAPPTNGKAPSRQTLCHRVQYHMRGNAEGSTLRLSLGCLMANQLGIELRRVGSGKRLTFSTGEQRLSEWLTENARVAWMVCDPPWRLEQELIAGLSLRSILDQNKNHASSKSTSSATILSRSIALDLSRDRAKTSVTHPNREL
jgi:hypothetical protein